MNKLSWIPLLTIGVASLLVLAACGDSSRPGTMTDSGGIMLLDGGPGGTDSGPTPGTDSGPGASCTTDDPLPRTVPMFAGAPPCANATLSCLMACSDAACQNGCIDMDPMAMACENCLIQNQTSCVNANGCQAQWTEIACCINTMCPADGACADTTCMAADSAFTTCLMGAAGSCGAALGACFMPM